VNPGGGAGWDEPPLDIQIPDDARELDRDVLAYHRELRVQRRRSRLRRIAGPLAGHGTLMPLLASILAVCLVAGAMLSVATFSPATTPADQTHPTATASSSPPVTPKTSTAPSSSTPSSSTPSSSARASSGQSATAQASGTGRAIRSANPSASGTRPAASARAAATSTGTP
jgi:hypothetical protein